MKRSERIFEFKGILFLCTGNYFRSRFAELLFNHGAQRVRLAWRATSRGVGLELAANNLGSISPHAFSGLSVRGVSLGYGTLRAPLALVECDLMNADLIIALKRDEHLPLIMRKFPQWASRIEFWRIDDLDSATPDETLAKIDHNVTTLIKRLSQNDS